MNKLFSENKIAIAVVVAAVIVAGSFYFNKQKSETFSNQKTFIETHDYIFDIPALVGKSAEEIKSILSPDIGGTRLEPYIKLSSQITNKGADAITEKMFDELDFLYGNSMLFDRYNYFLEVEYKDNGKVGCMRLRYNSNSLKDLLKASNIKDDYKQDSYFEIAPETWPDSKPTIFSGLSFCPRSK